MPSLESLCFSLGFEGGNLGCPGNLAGMSRTPGAVQKVCAKNICAHFSFPVLGPTTPTFFTFHFKLRDRHDCMTGGPYDGNERIRKAPDTSKFVRDVMRAICLSDQSALIDGSLSEANPLKPVLVLSNATRISTAQTSMRTIIVKKHIGDLNSSGASPKSQSSPKELRRRRARNRHFGAQAKTITDVLTS